MKKSFAYLFVFFLITPAFASPVKVSFKTKDGVILQALFEKPQPGNPIVVCLHGLAAWKEEWTPLMQTLSRNGWGVLSYDARGHGESSLTKDSKGNPDGFQHFGPPAPGSEWGRMIDDVGVAVRFARSQSGQTDSAVFLAGASVGANVALIYASLSTSIQGVILLSPGLEYVAFKTEEPIRKISCPVLLIASPADGYAYQSVQKLKQIQPQSALWTDVKPGHGVQMFDEKLLQRIFLWLNQHK